jgi:uncharacterized protein
VPRILTHATLRRRLANKRSPKAETAGRIVDFHVHMNPWDLLKPDVERVLRSTQPQYDELKRYWSDPRAFLRRMDEEDVERACLINYVAPDVMGYQPTVNDWAHRYAQADPDRLVAFGGFHPAAVKDAKAEVERLLSKLELRGIKIHGPHMLLAPNAYLEGTKGLALLYERCQELGVPVMFHTGTTVFPGARNKYGDPMLIDDVAVDYPRLKIVLAHGGRPLWMETATFLVRRHPHVWMDISSVPPKSLLEYFPKLEQLSEKVLYGSDWPGPHVTGMRPNADALMGLPLTGEAKRRILRGNAERLLSGS